MNIQSLIRSMGRAVAAALALPLCAAGAAHAQTDSYPARALRMVVPYPAGGPVDTAARNLAKGLSEQLRQPVVVDNKPGASGTLGASEVAKAQPDGYTVLFSLPDPFTYVQHLFKKVAYEPLKDFAPITQVATTPPVLVLRNDAPVPSLQALGPGVKDVRFGTWGPGTYPHLIAAGLAVSTRSDLVIVGYRGGAPAIQDFTVATDLELNGAVPDLPATDKIKVIFAETPLQAEDLLCQVRTAGPEQKGSQNPSHAAASFRRPSNIASTPSKRSISPASPLDRV